ncbi:hypothetical protein ACLOJK_001912 [Asimina triloba]
MEHWFNARGKRSCSYPHAQPSVDHRYPPTIDCSEIRSNYYGDVGGISFSTIASFRLSCQPPLISSWPRTYLGLHSNETCAVPTRLELLLRRTNDDWPSRAGAREEYSKLQWPFSCDTSRTTTSNAGQSNWIHMHQILNKQASRCRLNKMEGPNHPPRVDTLANMSSVN